MDVIASHPYPPFPDRFRGLVQAMLPSRAKNFWTYFWMHFASASRLGRAATWFATWFAPPYYGRCYLARFNVKGFVSPSATIYHDDLHLGSHVFIGDRVVIFKDRDGGPVALGEGVYVYGETFIQTGFGGSVEIGPNSHIHPRCQISAYMAPIRIGSGVQVAPNCAFYPYDHGFAAGRPIIEQPLKTKGGIIVDDDAWLGFGVIVLDGVRIGKGAVVGAGSVVTHDIPDGGIATGAPAHVVKMRI
jgi:acetyltransferase-like isoleucine patch superfamily enzyme